MEDLIEIGGQNRARAAIGQQRPGVLQNQREKDRRRRERERRRGHKSAYRPQSTTSNYQRDSVDLLLHRIDTLLIELGGTGIQMQGKKSERQKTYAGHGSIKDLKSATPSMKKFIVKYKLKPKDKLFSTSEFYDKRKAEQFLSVIKRKGGDGEIVNESVYDIPFKQGDKIKGWIAMYNGKKFEIKKSEAKDLYAAKQLALKHFKVPKMKEGLLAIAPAY